MKILQIVVVSCWLYGYSACLHPGAFLKTHFILQRHARRRVAASVILPLFQVLTVNWEWARVYIWSEGAGDYYSWDSRGYWYWACPGLWIHSSMIGRCCSVRDACSGRLSGCCPNPHYFCSELSPQALSRCSHLSLVCPVGRCRGYIGEEMGCCCSGVYLHILYEI